MYEFVVLSSTTRANPSASSSVAKESPNAAPSSATQQDNVSRKAYLRHTDSTLIAPQSREGANDTHNMHAHTTHAQAHTHTHASLISLTDTQSHTELHLSTDETDYWAFRSCIPRTEDNQKAAATNGMYECNAAQGVAF